MRPIPHQLLTLLILFFPCLIEAAENQKTHTIEWLQPYEKKFSADDVFKTLNFTDAKFDENLQPRYVITRELPFGTRNVKVQLFNIASENVSDVSLIRNRQMLASDFIVETKIIIRKKRPYAAISVLPLRKSASGGIERLSSFEIDVQPESSQTFQQSTHSFAASSVLATGDWFKIGVLQTGIYKVDYAQLKSLGVDVDNIDPRNIQLFGNGGGMLPFSNSQPRHDDLTQNAIFVSGESDQRFDNTDFILFYGNNQNKWNYNSTTRQFNHQLNYYSDTTYYFVTVGSTQGKRIQQRNSLPAGNLTVTTFDDYIFHEAELYNFLKSGREWFGETMDNINSTITFSHLLQNLVSTDSVHLRSALAGRSPVTQGSPNYISSITLNVNGSNLTAQNYTNVGSSVQDNYVALFNINRGFIPPGNNLSLKFILSTSNPTGQAWLNHYELNFRRYLNGSGMGNQFSFRDKNSVGAGNLSDFQISNTTPSYNIWDVTNPLEAVSQAVIHNSGVTSFICPTDELREFIAFNNENFLKPYSIGKIENQNLHALAQANMIIVVHPLFMPQAYELAEFHRTYNNLSVIVASTSQIFNEFSSGAQDVSAIRDFVKMFYDRAGTDSTQLPKYLLLFGDASYDNKHRISGNTNFVTSYQSSGSINLTQTYITDDFFAWLDNTEGEGALTDIVDLSYGRLPVKTTTEAQAAVNKIKHYVQGNGPGVPNPTLGNWRTTISFVADDQDRDTHFKQTDTLANRIQRLYPLYNIDKLYLDSYNQISTPGGQRYADGHKAIVDRIERGSLLMTYIGHGGELGWAHERVLEVDDINNWTNFDRQAAFLTATCEFTRVDDPSRNSAGEFVFLNPSGGGICLFTTSRLAFSSSNYNLCQKFFTHVFEKDGDRHLSIGEIFERTKVDYFADPYVRNFLLIGDPAVTLKYPTYSIKTKTINGVDISLPVDTLKALSKVVVTGEVQDLSGNKMTNFNGTIFSTIYDKMILYYTLGNDINDPGGDISTIQPFKLQKNVIYGGKASVLNGDFTFTFIVPKDISFQFGKGKLSYYAHNGSIDAAGFDTTFVVGGVNENFIPDGEGPKIKLYINDEKFVRGGLTDENPVLYAVVTDSSGLNTVGTGIGHDMTAVLDSKSEKKYVLNDYFENDLDSYQAGKVKYPFKSLDPGPHTLVFKVWDVFNNSSEATTDFVVSESAELALQHVLNYPNPFTTHTTFMFEHNRPYSPLDVQVQVFTVSGKLIKTISDKITTAGYRSDDLEWDGLDDFGDKIGKGVYVYRLRVKTSGGEYADHFEKLVILR